jgi:hypothetical protein
MGRSSFYKDTCYIDKYVASNPDVYGSVETWTAGTVLISCAIMPEEYSRGEQSDKTSFTTFWNMECAYGVNIVEKDKVRADSKTFEVLSVHDPMRRGVDGRSLGCIKVKLRYKT